MNCDLVKDESEVVISLVFTNKYKKLRLLKFRNLMADYLIG